MNQTVRQIAEYVAGSFRGDGERILKSVASLTNAGPDDLSYAEEKFRDDATRSNAGCIIMRAGEFPGKTVILAANPKAAFARAAHVLLAPDVEDRTIHPSAVVANDAVIGSNVRVGPGAVIESGAAIGENSTIEAGAYVGRRSRIGTGCTLYPRVVIYADVQIGNRVIVHAGAVIGADGFGFVRDGLEYVKFPQKGTVIVEDDVEIGANTCVDRGSLETTIIHKGVKLDNLVQVAHNVEIGQNTVIAAQTGISGSSSIGAQSIIAGQVGIGEHARIDDFAIVGGQAGVLNGKHLKNGEVMWGTPAKPLKEFLSQQAHLSRLPRLREEFQRLRKEFEELKSKLISH